MDVVYKLMGEHDENILYVLFGIQCLICVIGYPLLISSCVST